MVETLDTERQASPRCAFIGPPRGGSLDPFHVCLLQSGSRLSLDLVSFTQGSSFIFHCLKGQIFDRFLSSPDSLCTSGTEDAMGTLGM
jgi:hypothetical protein